MKHSAEYRVYYENTDAGGITYHGDYINFCERARTDFMHAIGHSCRDMKEQDGVLFVIRHLEADYLKPSTLEDMLRVESSVVQVKNTSFVMRQTIFCHDAVLFDMTVTAVCVDKNGKPVRIPQKLREAITTYCE